MAQMMLLHQVQADFSQTTFSISSRINAQNAKGFTMNPNVRLFARLIAVFLITPETLPG